MLQYDGLKGSHMTKVVWLPNETDYSYCEFVVPYTPYSVIRGVSIDECPLPEGPLYHIYSTVTGFTTVFLLS